jgi:Arc/MetJ-type ribon-helix-helix transcriptional regulator
MMIHLPQDIESSIQAAVHRGHFSSVDEAMAKAARLLLQSLKEGTHTARKPLTEQELERKLLDPDS